MTAPHSDGELKTRAEAEVLACIGCNDCLLACPIPQSRLVTIAELNRAVGQATLSDSNVVEFVSACTQCRQCVPACPADLNRADMVLFNKLKVEDSAPDRELSLQAKTVAFPAGITLDGLALQLLGLELFRGGSEQALRRLLSKSTLRLLVPGEELCREGEFHEQLCVVLSGVLEQQSAGAGARPIHVLKLAPGSFFGEMGVLSDSAEPFTVLAAQTSVVLVAPKLAVLRLMDQAPTVRAALEALYEKRALFSYSRDPNGLGVLPEAALVELLSHSRLEHLSAGQLLFRHDDAPGDFFLVRSGFLRASQHDEHGERVLTYFREGNLFGILPLLRGARTLGYGVQAASRAEVIRVSGAALGPLFARYPHAHESLMRAGFEAEALALSSRVGLGPVEAEPRSSLSASFLVEEGLAKGRELLVIDQERCTACGNCVDACERRHGHGRLQLRGIQVDTLLFPAACRHCADPACLLCSVNGIVRLPSGEIQIVADNCIGCGSCAERCPYGNISMHPLEKPKRSLLGGLFDFLVKGEPRELALEALDPRQQRVAVKCDLCAEFTDYACVTACPVNAAFRIDPGAVLERAAAARRTRV